MTRPFLIGLVLCAGCQGRILGEVQPPGTTQTNQSPVSFTCTPGTSQLPYAMNPLSASEYTNTLRSLLTYALKDPNAANQVMAGLPMSLLPNDPGRAPGTFQRMKTDVTQGHLIAWYWIATGVGQALTQPNRIGTVMGSCATDGVASNDATCLSNFVAGFGAQAFRRPLTSAELASHIAYDTGGTGVDAAGVADVIAGILMAPRFIYHVENGAAPVAEKSNVYTVDPFELASRVSYQFWEDMPDAQLVASAQSGDLATSTGYAAQVDRVYADPRSQATLDEFYREWMNLDQAPTLENDLLFTTFLGPSFTPIISPSTPQNMVQEAVDLFNYETWQSSGGLDDLMTTDRAFPRTADLAAIYGLPQWDGASAPPQFAPGTRPGFLTRAAFLLSGGVADRPIQRGVLVRRNVLCDTIPDPPADAAAMGMATAAPLIGTESTRKITEAITEQPGSLCESCHGALINPIGFAFEAFDGIGRLRTQEALFQPTGTNDPQTGQPLYAQTGLVPVDSSTVPAVSSSDTRPSTGVSDLTRYIVGSGKTSVCFARQYFRFTYRHAEDDPTDGCALEELRQSAANNGSLLNALKMAAMAPEFQQRSFQ